MSDFAGAMPIKVTDSTDPTKQLKVNADGSINVTGSTTSIVTATDLDIRPLTAAEDTVTVVATALDTRHLSSSTDSVAVSGTVGVSGTVTVSATALDTRHLSASNDTVTVTATSFDMRPLKASTDSVAVSGAVTVSATALDTRLLTSSDTVTVVASNLSIRALTSATDSMTVTATALDTRHLTAATDTVAVTGSVVVTATALDVRALAASKDSVKISDGTNSIAVNADGSLNVVAAPSAAIPVCSFNKSGSDVAAGGNVEFDYIVTNAKKFSGLSVIAASRGACMVEVGTKVGTTFTVLAQYFQQPAFAQPMPIAGVAMMGNGSSSIHIRLTNLEAAATAMYSTIQGQEI